MNNIKIYKGEITSDLLASQRERNEFVTRSGDLLKVKFDDIMIRENFNTREELGDIESLADSIASIGLKRPLTVDILKDGTIVINDGERRYRAISLLRDRDEGMRERFDMVNVLPNEKIMTEVDRIVAMMAENTGKPLEPLEEAEGFRRLRDLHGYDPATIAVKVGRTHTYVSNRLLLADVSPEERELVRTHKIEASAMIELARKEKDPEKRRAKIKSFNDTGKKPRVRDVKQTSVDDLCDESLEIIKRIQNESTESEVVNLAIELQTKLLTIKKNAG